MAARAGLALAGLAPLTAAAQAPAAPPLAIAWQAPAPAAEVTWRGIPQLDASADAAGGILYPAPSLIGFLAAVLTHAAMSSAAQSAEQERAQRQADTVLGPYAATLKGLGAEALWRAALAAPVAPVGSRLAQGAEPDAWRAEATPRFALAPDAGTVVLDLGAKLLGPGRAPLELVIRVVSTPPAVADVRGHWTANDGQALRDTAATLLAHALALASEEARVRSAAAAAEPAAFRTHRYRLGALMRTERSQLVAQACGRIVLRTLRGGLLSAPVWPAPEAAPPTAQAAASGVEAVAASASASASAPGTEGACAAAPGL
jgi:hypothetical protein